MGIVRITTAMSSKKLAFLTYHTSSAALSCAEIEPMLAKITALPKDLGKADVMLGDNGYFSAANVTACMAAGLEPLIALAPGFALSIPG